MWHLFLRDLSSLLICKLFKRGNRDSFTVITTAGHGSEKNTRLYISVESILWIQLFVYWSMLASRFFSFCFILTGTFSTFTSGLLEQEIKRGEREKRKKRRGKKLEEGKSKARKKREINKRRKRDQRGNVTAPRCNGGHFCS